MSNRIVLLVTLEDTEAGLQVAWERSIAQYPPLDPPSVDAVRAEIQSNLESVWPYAGVSVEDVTEPMCSICRTRGRHNHACE